MVVIKKEDTYFIGESPDYSLTAKFYIKKQIVKIFPAFESKNYRLYFVGQLISLIGTWLQYLAQGWLVLQLTNSAFVLGIIAACQTLPTLLFSLIAGVIIDRYPKKKVLMFTQIFAMIQALILGLLTIFNLVTVWHIGILAFVLGTVNAIDAPARQAFASELVKRKALNSAIAMNAGIFNAARVIGPSTAGILIGLIGLGGTFLLNAFSYIAVLIALSLIFIQEKVSHHHLHPIKAIKEGLVYVFSNSVLRKLFFLVTINAIFGWSHTTLLPLIAKQTYGLDATGLGYLFSASGIGALLAMVIISANSHRSPLPFIIIGNVIFSIGMILFSYTNSFPVGFVLLFFTGLGLLLQLALLNATIQQLIKDKIRGRVMSIYVLFLIGMFPLGNLQIGYLAERFGTAIAIRSNAIVVLVGGIIFYFFQKSIFEAIKLREEHDKDFV